MVCINFVKGTLKDCAVEQELFDGGEESDNKVTDHEITDHEVTDHEVTDEPKKKRRRRKLVEKNSGEKCETKLKAKVCKAKVCKWCYVAMRVWIFTILEVKDNSTKKY